MTFQNPTATLYTPPAVAQTAIAAPTAPASTSAYACQGLGALLTPQKAAGNVLAIITATLTASATTAAFGVNMQIAYGPTATGAAPPANAAALPGSGVAVGLPTTFKAGTTLTSAGDLAVPVAVAAIVPGLTAGQQYWFDVIAESVGSGYALTNVNVTLVEIG